jgi:hypothetical protein
MIRWLGLTFASLLFLAFPASSSTIDAKEIYTQQQTDSGAEVEPGQESAPDQPADSESEAEPEKQWRRQRRE